MPVKITARVKRYDETGKINYDGGETDFILTSSHME